MSSISPITFVFDPSKALTHTLLGRTLSALTFNFCRVDKGQIFALDPPSSRTRVTYES